ncbi:hypothetical protein EYR38_010555 [Pleurotus pulmonarius]|nr:hypothetical protein EYR38_010555 [Pleurotus pulmonarius]
MRVRPSLVSVPPEVLEHIAFLTATDEFLGPPSAIIPLLSTNKRLNSCLSIKSNTLLYSRIFAAKFDVSPPLRRLRCRQPSAAALTQELQRRCYYLKRMRARLDSTVNPFAKDRSGDEILQSLLWTAYLMMLENDGKNERQLRDYAQIDVWLREFWFDDHGASFAKSSIRMDQWPPNNDKTSLGMWLFWFLLNPDEYMDDEHSWDVVNTLKIFALGAHQYQLTSPSWVDFVPDSHQSRSNKTMHYLGSLPLLPAPLAAPAILAFLTLVNKVLGSPTTMSYSVITSPSLSGIPSKSLEWECEWGRCLSLGHGEYDRFLTASYKPGSIEGIWEGMFTYTEFTAYAALLSGAPPPVLQKSMVVRHRQTWKLREYHLLSAESSSFSSGIYVDADNIHPLPAGDPLKSYFPTGTHISEHSGIIEVREPHSQDVVVYRRATSVATDGNNQSACGTPCVLDVIITGEGHSAWGQFSLVGRVRPCDGFISLCKEYVDGDRGKWLYRGYLVGAANGNLAGRWRDTLSPAEVPGYEGCFTMSRRR